MANQLFELWYETMNALATIATTKPTDYQSWRNNFKNLQEIDAALHANHIFSTEQKQKVDRINKFEGIRNIVRKLDADQTLSRTFIDSGEIIMPFIHGMGQYLHKAYPDFIYSQRSFTPYAEQQILYDQRKNRPKVWEYLKTSVHSESKPHIPSLMNFFVRNPFRKLIAVFSYKKLDPRKMSSEDSPNIIPNQKNVSITPRLKKQVAAVTTIILAYGASQLYKKGLWQPQNTTQMEEMVEHSSRIKTLEGLIQFFIKIVSGMVSNVPGFTRLQGLILLLGILSSLGLSFLWPKVRARYQKMTLKNPQHKKRINK